MSPAATSGVPFPVSAGPRVARRRLAHDERPAVRLRHHGAHSLSDSELIALLTRKRVASEEDLQAARALLRDGLASLVHRVLSGAADVPHDDARRLAAAIELGRRSLAPPPPRALYSLESAGRRLAARYAGEVQERLGALLLDARGRIIAEREVVRRHAAHRPREHPRRPPPGAQPARERRRRVPQPPLWRHATIRPGRGLHTSARQCGRAPRYRASRSPRCRR